MKNIKVILIKDFRGLGRKNDIIDVNPGYAMNYLIPNKIAIKHSAFASNKLSNEVESKNKLKQEQIEKELEVKKNLESKNLIIKLKSHNNKAIGGANPSFLSKEIQKQFGYEISKTYFLSTSSIHEFGIFTKGLKLPNGTICNIKVEVIKD